MNTFLNIGTRDKSHFLVWILGIVLCFFSLIVGASIIHWVLVRQTQKYPELDDSHIDAFYANPDFSVFHIDPSLGLCLLIVPFVIASIILISYLSFVHKRSWLSLITPSRKIDFRRIGFAFLLWFIISGLLEFAYYFIQEDTVQFQFNATRFFTLLIVAIFVLPIQTTFEEVYVRGYLMQGLAKIKSSPWFPILLSAIFFGMLHGSNPEIDKYGFIPMQGYYISAGVFLALITVLDQRLELAIGIHMATNIFGSVIVTYENSPLQTESLFKSTTANPIYATLLLWIAAIVFVIICSKKYHWKDISTLIKNTDT